MKRGFLVFLIFLLLSTEVCCAQGLDFASMTDDELSAILSGASIELAMRKMEQQNCQLLFEKDDISVYLTGESDFWEDEGMETLVLEVCVINQGPIDTYLYTESFYANAALINNSIGIWDIEPYSAIEDSLFIDFYDTGFTKMDMLQDIAFRFDLYDDSTNDPYDQTDELKLSFDGGIIMLNAPTDPPEAVSGTPQTIILAAINAEITFPENYHCQTRSQSDAASDQIFADHQYLIASSSALSASLTCLNSSGTDYLLLSDQAIKRDIVGIATQLKAYGMTLLGHEILRTDNNAFLVTDCSLVLDGVTIYQRQYSTLKSNLYANLTFTSESPFTEQQTAEMLAIASSLVWKPYSGFTYSTMTIEDVGISFQYPDQWLHEESIEYPFTYNSFLFTPPDGIKRIIIIAHANAAPYLKTPTGIADSAQMDIDQVSKSVLARYVIGVDENRLFETEINGEFYYLYRMTKAEDNASSDVIYQYFHLRDGIIYMFQFDAETDDAYYPVFEALLRSILYL